MSNSTFDDGCVNWMDGEPNNISMSVILSCHAMTMAYNNLLHAYGHHLLCYVICYIML